MNKLTHGIALFCLLTMNSFADDGFTSLFDGKSLDGWKSPDMSYWTVEDGAITATCSDEHPCKKNQFLVWQRGEVDNFEFKLKFKIEGLPQANSGIQIRSQIAEDGHAIGYQADIDRAGKWLGALYDEHTGRRVLAKRGQKTSITADGKRDTQQVKDPDELKQHINLDGWNEYYITAQGPHITLRINGEITVEFIDNETAY